MRTNSTSDTKPAALTLLGGLGDKLHERRQARAAYGHLKRELACYRTPSEISDLLTAVDSHGDDPRVEQVRRILEQNLWDYRRRQGLAS